MKAVKNSQLTIRQYINNNTDVPEAGLNLVQIQTVIQRKLPLIAGVMVAFSSLATVRVLTSPPVYTSGFELLSEPVNIETKVTSSDDESRKTREEIASVELDTVQLKVLKSPRLINKAVETIEYKYPELNYQNLIQNLTVDIYTDSNSDQNILQVSYENANKEQVSDVIDALKQIYVEYSVEKRQSGVKRGIAFLDRQIPRISKESETVDKQISTLRSQYNFTNPEDAVESVNEQINRLAQEKERNEIQLKQLELTINNLKQEFELNPARAITAIDFGTPRYETLANRLKEIDIEIKLKAGIFSSESPEIQVLEQKREQMLSLLKEAGEDTIQKLRNQIEGIKNRQVIIDNRIIALQKKLAELSVISADFNGLVQKQNRTNNQLNEFILQKDSLLIDAAQKDAPWQLLTPAGEPTTNNIGAINYLILSSTLGLVVGVGCALGLEKYQDIIYNSAQIQGLTDLPILGSIPYNPQLNQLLLIESISIKPAQADTDSSFLARIPIQSSEQINQFDFETPSVEIFRSFAANLGLVNTDNGIGSLNSQIEVKSLVVTSATAKEGKSIVALNLSRAAASMGKKVLLVDTDLRNPERLTKMLGCESDLGLKNMLTEDNPKINLDCIQKLSQEENLYFLSSGFDDLTRTSMTADLSRLLVSSKMQFITEILETKFDIVIYDLCSIIGFADVSLIANKTDGILIVTGLGKIQTTTLTEALNQLKLCQAPILGIAVNKLTRKN